MPDIITRHQVLIHDRLSDRLHALERHLLAATKTAPDRPVSPLLARAAAQLFRSVHRLLSRETGSHGLPRLAARQRPLPAELALLLADTRLALDSFAYANRDWRNLFEGDWLTREDFLEAMLDDE
jgi:hypothetical protein